MGGRAAGELPQQELMERRVEPDVPQPERGHRRAHDPQRDPDRGESRGRINATIAATTTSSPAGLNANDAPRWPCTAATHARVMPHSGHGMPVSARSGQASVGCTGRSGHAAAAPTSPPARDAELARRARFERGRRGHDVHDTPARVRCGHVWRRRCLRARTRDGCWPGCRPPWARAGSRDRARSTSAPPSAARGGGRGSAARPGARWR